MSLILEALKKSEAKRRLGEAPDLGTPFSAPRRRSKVLPIVAVLIVVALIGWAATRGPAPAPSSKADATVPTAASTSFAPAPTPGQKSGTPLHAVTGDNNLSPTPAPTNLPKAPPPPSDMGNAFVATGPYPRANGAPRRTPEEMRDRRRSAAVASGAQPPSNAGRAHSTPPPSNPVATAPPAAVAAPAVTPPARSVGAAPAAAPAGKFVAAPPPQSPAAPASASTPPAPVETRAPKMPGTIGLPAALATAPPAPAAAKTATPNAGAQSYSELPFSVRKSLPDLRLSMHVYMPDPAQRFVILNDSRIIEGEKTTDDVNVREIRPDGVVLEFQGQRFFYPRDGL